MTPFGAVCFHPLCMTKLGSNTMVSEKTLREHFDNSQCYTGIRPDCTDLVRNLKRDLATLQELAQKGGACVDALVERVLPGDGVTRFIGSYCRNCGRIGKPSLLKRDHFTDQNTKCNIEHLRCDGTIVKSPIISNMKIPEELVRLILGGGFTSGQWNDPREKRIERRMQSIAKLSCEPSGRNKVRKSPPHPNHSGRLKHH